MIALFKFSFVRKRPLIGKPGIGVAPDDAQGNSPGDGNPESERRQSRMPWREHGEKLNGGIDRGMKENRHQNTAFGAKVQPGEEKSQGSYQEGKIVKGPIGMR